MEYSLLSLLIPYFPYLLFPTFPAAIYMASGLPSEGAGAPPLPLLLGVAGGVVGVGGALCLAALVVRHRKRRPATVTRVVYEEAVNPDLLSEFIVIIIV